MRVPSLSPEEFVRRRGNQDLCVRYLFLLFLSRLFELPRKTVSLRNHNLFRNLRKAPTTWTTCGRDGVPNSRVGGRMAGGPSCGAVEGSQYRLVRLSLSLDVNDVSA